MRTWQQTKTTTVAISKNWKSEEEVPKQLDTEGDGTCLDLVSALWTNLINRDIKQVFLCSRS